MLMDELLWLFKKPRVWFESQGILLILVNFLLFYTAYGESKLFKLNKHHSSRVLFIGAEHL